MNTGATGARFYAGSAGRLDELQACASAGNT